MSDLFNNQYIGDARAYSDAIEASGNINNNETIKYDKNSWYISYKPLPEVIATDENVLDDLLSCAAKGAMMSRPLQELEPKVKNNDYSYFEWTFSGYGASGIMCIAPHMYQYYYHKNTNSSII